MDIKYTSSEKSVSALLCGELDEYSAEFVRISLDDVAGKLSDKQKELILDFSGVTFMDSTGIGMLLGRYNKFIKKDVSIYIKNPSSYVNRIFEMTGIYQIIPKVG
ncbi:MAG: STAS domain-containing protein [Clostridia bacterium]|nr:STAS domain-containing protein [Clostridia bacterium]